METKYSTARVFSETQIPVIQCGACGQKFSLHVVIDPATDTDYPGTSTVVDQATVDYCPFCGKEHDRLLRPPQDVAAEGSTTCTHCWHFTGKSLTSNPPQHERRCCKCGAEGYYVQQPWPQHNV